MLYRLEVHDVTRTELKQQEFESDTLGHLRKIAFLAPNALPTFMYKVVSPLYAQRQMDLLSRLFDNLNMDYSEELLTLSSPLKSATPKR